MPKIWTATVVALFVAAVSFFAFADPPGVASAADAPSASAATDAGPPPDAGPFGAAATMTAAKPLATGTGSGSDTTAPPDLESPGSFTELVQAFRSGDWRLVAAFALAGVMMLLRRARDQWAWFRGDRGGAILVAALSVFGALSTSLATHQPVNPQLFISALAIAWTAVGGYTWVKRLIWPDGSGAAPDVTSPAPLPKAQVVT